LLSRNYTVGMTEPIEWLLEPDLRDPMLLAAFSGWGDASDAATGAARWLISHLHGERIARIRPDDFFDFTVARPSVRLENGGQRAIVWPTVDVYAAHAPGLERDFVVMYGREPHLHWPDFAAAVVAIAERCRVSRGLTLGAFLGPVLHAAPVQLTGFATEEELVRRLTETDVIPSTYQGQTGILSILHDAFHRAGLPSLSLWAAVPFYLGSLRPNPRATYALLMGLRRILELDVDLDRLQQAAVYFDEQIERQVRDNKELRELIERLEAQPALSGAPEIASPAAESTSELPSADSIIRDLEAFLRRNQAGEGSEQSSDQD
jgi:predicted ATP-grasp superfamily ATP-dependent carboligase